MSGENLDARERESIPIDAFSATVAPAAFGPAVTITIAPTGFMLTGYVGIVRKRRSDG